MCKTFTGNSQKTEYTVLPKTKKYSKNTKIMHVHSRRHMISKFEQIKLITLRDPFYLAYNISNDGNPVQTYRTGSI